VRPGRLAQSAPDGLVRVAPPATALAACVCAARFPLVRVTVGTPPTSPSDRGVKPGPLAEADGRPSLQVR
jgi:hypothetical protein